MLLLCWSGEGECHQRLAPSLEGERADVKVLVGGVESVTQGGWGETRNSRKGLAGIFIEPKTILLEFIIATPITLLRENGFY